MATEVYGVNWLPVSVASEMMNVSRQRVYQLSAEGKLNAVQMGGTTLISRDSILKRILTMSKRGRKK